MGKRGILDFSVSCPPHQRQCRGRCLFEAIAQRKKLEGKICVNLRNLWINKKVDSCEL